MIFYLRAGLLVCYRIPKIATCAWRPRRCLPIRISLVAFAALCLTSLIFIAFFVTMVGRQHQISLVKYTLIGTDSHTSVLQLHRSEISVRRIELLSKPCLSCGNSQGDSGTRSAVGVFLVYDVTESFLENKESIHKDLNIEGPLKIQESTKDDFVKVPPKIRDSKHKDDVIRVPLETSKTDNEDDAVKRFSGIQKTSDASERLSTEEQEEAETFINCQPSFDYVIYVVLKSDRNELKEIPSEDPIQATTPWIDRLLRKTVEDCQRQRTNITAWLITVSSELSLVSALNDVLIEAYFDNVTWYDFLLWPGTARRSRMLRKWAVEPTEVLARTKNVGIVTSGGCCGRRFFVHRCHYDIFGHFFPLTDWTMYKAVRYLSRLYSPQWSSYQRNGFNDDQTATAGINNTTLSGIRPVVVSDNNDGQDVSVNGSDCISHPEDEKNHLSEIIDTDRHVLQRYVKALDASNCGLQCSENRRSGRVIAMSLYGDDPKYTIGAVRNAQLLPVIFPGWRLRIFCERQGPSETEEGPASCASVPLQVTRKLEELGAELRYIDPGGLAPMLWRFLPVDDVTVDVFISRDSDSRLTERDAAIVSAWLDTDTLFHCIRDHPSHAAFSVSGGLWGARTKWLRLLMGNRSIATLKQYSNSYLEDMRFLGSELWPLVKSLAYCHDSVSCDKWPSSHPIRVPRQRAEHVGQVFDAYSVPRKTDIELLMAAERNSKCEPIPPIELPTLSISINK